MDDEANTPAARLERALCEHEASNKAAADLSAQHAQELEKLKAMHAQLEALPEHERRKVLDAAGMQRVSAVPKPIDPIRGAGYAPAPSSRPVRWVAWLALPNVQLWEAVALSLDVEPADVPRWAYDKNLAAPYKLSPPAAAFRERLELCQRVLAVAGPIRPQGGLYAGMLGRPTCKVLLPEVAAFLSRAGEVVPTEMQSAQAVAGYAPHSQPEPPVAPGAKEEAPQTSRTLPDDPMQKRSVLLNWFRDAGGRRPSESGKPGKRGALTRVVEKSGIDKDTLGTMLDKAIEERRNADAFAQLTARR